MANNIGPESKKDGLEAASSSQAQGPTDLGDSLDSKTAPPAYDTLSLAPPSIRQDSQSNEPSSHRRASFTKLKQKYKDLKDQNDQRKERVVHVTHEEAHILTGNEHRNDENGCAKGIIRPSDYALPGLGLA